MTTAANPDTLLEIAKLVASLGLSTSVVILGILAWRSPQLAHELFSFVRGLICDFRAPPKGEKKSKAKQTSDGREG